MEKYFFIVGLLFPFCIFSQTIEGTVANENGEPLIGANVYWFGTDIGVSTEIDGTFEISSKDVSDKKLIASYVGYQADTIEISIQSIIKFNLEDSQTLGEVIVTEQKDGVMISSLNPIKTEQITQTELKKAACCDLAGCFGTQTTVQAHTTNVITNSKELRILGLSGVYNQVLIDGFPMIQGLSYTYGISSIPGTLVSDIMIAKGANSVLQGYESISGQINVITKQPDKTDKLLLNLYLNSFAEKQFNANYAFQEGKWSNLTAFHTVQPANKIDRDGDHFLDVPLLTRYMIFNNWKYGKETDWGWNSNIGVRLLKEQRIGGQTFFDQGIDKGSATIYGQTVNFTQPEIWAKTGFRVDDKHTFVLHVSAFHHEQDAYFGTVKYKAKQASFYSNIQYELNYLEKHDLKTGFSFRHLNLDENISFTADILERTYAGNYNRLENIPGIFAENTLRFFNNKLTWIAGIRADRHNQFGLMVTPKTLLKYDVSSKTVFRANIGTGWRTVNLFSENINLLASSRDIVFIEDLEPEKAINYGINLVQRLGNKNILGYFSADFYRTDFQNQVFPDYDTDPTKALIQNFTGTSISNGFQAELSLNFWKRFDWKFGYNFLDVYREINGSKQALPFNAKHRFLMTFAYAPLSKKIHFDMNLHWTGKQRLPDTKSNPEEYQRPDYSEPYTIVNAQFTCNFKRFEVYGGCENIFDFRQLQPIISWEDPFGPYFDTSSVWGPTKGQEFYVGVRFLLKNE